MKQYVIFTDEHEEGLVIEECDLKNYEHEDGKVYEIGECLGSIQSVVESLEEESEEDIF